MTKRGKSVDLYKFAFSFRMLHASVLFLPLYNVNDACNLFSMSCFLLVGVVWVSSSLQSLHYKRWIFEWFFPVISPDKPFSCSLQWAKPWVRVRVRVRFRVRDRVRNRVRSSPTVLPLQCTLKRENFSSFDSCQQLTIDIDCSTGTRTVIMEYSLREA